MLSKLLEAFQNLCLIIEVHIAGMIKSLHLVSVMVLAGKS